MTRPLPAAVAIAVALMLWACSCGSDQPRSSRSTSTTAARGSNAATGLVAAQSGLEAEIARLTWPDAYTPTVRSLTPKLGDPKQIAMTTDNGTHLANIWNLCAWLDEGVDRIEGGAAPAQLDEVAAHLTAWASDGPGGIEVDEFVDGIRTGDPTDANQFIQANTCRPFPA